MIFHTAKHRYIPRPRADSPSRIDQLLDYTSHYWALDVKYVEKSCLLHVRYGNMKNLVLLAKARRMDGNCDDTLAMQKGEARKTPG